ncbi:chromosome segregation protein SMC [Neisseria sp. HMSC067G11]|jgi:chromosome segregation protein SMC|uniref:chromosome segregation protein SMC n=1 Tax=Neisseria TaxID=482 RepID=UPI00066C123F|nr:MULTISPECIES: chromosome segregation protein SMC [unclassified Neisseria]OFK04669.1 chromosome segregation protein SMC [Neisseria sp. HMSC067H04]OFL32764.1 chromosome segregation protein SMC [Neisseria sp. HMSC075C12]OFR56706.1 chromosome segregation protein SMC [Neisseria sp. HMSC067G11]OFR73333.1 chromosome segregation protein SMC [Neisseria sp. HMSC067G12]
MRLTHIKLSGFKSFTDPTTIHVPGQLVAVIGPNGCGKSNVIDAVRWVLGEASAKQLRGESMQDVIFNGAATRRPAPRASVELVFDNSDHSLQGAWGQYAEVSIKRQLTRQGESTYFINNQTVRRRDITDLFLGTGVGARGYAVIEQGMISRIIEARPEELRAYIEEAAGVSKYKERRKETEGRLKGTREHLQRLGDLQNELARQVEKLEKQAETAERYKSLTAQLNQQQDLLDYAQWQQSLAAADKATAQHQSLQAQQDETAAQIQALNDEVHALQTAEQSQQQAVHELSNKRGVLREQIARLEEQIRHQQNLHQRIERDKQAAQAQMQRIHQEQQQIRVKLEENELQVEEKQTELAEWAMQVAEHEERLPELEEAQATLNAAFQTQQDEANRIRRELALKQQQLAHAEQTVAKHEERKGRLKQENQALNLPDEAETAAAQEAAALLQSQQEHYEEQIIAAEEALHASREAFQTASNRFQSLKQQHITLQAQQQALSQILSQQQEAADFWQATDHTAAPQLWQHITAPAEWQHALSVILAERLHARAVPSGFVPPVPLPQGQAAWLSDDLSGGIKKSLPVQALLNQIQAQPPFQTALHHWLDGVLCAPDLGYALAHQSDLGAHQIWLTPEGHQVDKVSVLLYAKPAQESLIAQKARLDGIASELENLAPELSAAEAAFKQAEAAVRSSEVQHKNLMQQQQQHTRQYSQAQQRAAELLVRINQGQIRREHIERELAQLAEEQTVLQHTSDGLSDDIVTLQEAAAELEHQQQTTAHSRQEQQGRLKQAQLALLEANRQYGLAEVAVHKLNQQKQNYQQQIARLEQQTLDWQERQQELALAYETEFQNDEQHIKLDELTEAVHTLDEEYIAVQEKLAQIQEQGREQYAKVQTLQTQLPQLQAATQTALLQQQEALINAKRYHQNLTERAADLDALEALAKESPKVLNSSIGSLTQQIEALGAVNLAALQELEEARERDGYYRSQSEDVQAAITLLEEAIAQIDDKTKERFKETFDAVNGKVQTFFPTLFGGGEATLKMIGDDLLTAGVSIMARPPGKKNSTIHLLSGGEKALTAMSLVFALFSLNPAPFCLLDEVDAPLDDANTSRFCNLVKEMSAQTQFLYISHNRLTMEMAEQLVGVTMQEKGVSRVVAVDIKQALEMAEPN